jgi:hypothetical protein
VVQKGKVPYMTKISNSRKIYFGYGYDLKHWVICLWKGDLFCMKQNNLSVTRIVEFAQSMFEFTEEVPHVQITITA